MKWLIASDIHGSSYYCKKLIERINIEKPDKIILLGDLLYHGPRNDLPKEYDPKQVIDLLNSIDIDLYCVRGNCDSEVDQMVLNFPIMSDSLLVSDSGLFIYCTHGHLPKPTLKKDMILLSGHTHVPMYSNEEYIWMNPGSVSIPKNGSQHSYMIMEERKFVWKQLLDGEIYNEVSI